VDDLIKNKSEVKDVTFKASRLALAELRCLVLFRDPELFGDSVLT
jgi:hypothetical protein